MGEGWTEDVVVMKGIRRKNKDKERGKKGFDGSDNTRTDTARRWTILPTTQR
jgi:hypothetical protein